MKIVVSAERRPAFVIFDHLVCFVCLFSGIITDLVATNCGTEIASTRAFTFCKLVTNAWIDFDYQHYYPKRRSYYR